MLDALLARDALAAARRQLAAQAATDEGGAGTRLQQARLLGEIIRRIADPSQPLPAGDRAPIILMLTREAVFQVLSAQATATAPGEGGDVVAPDVVVPDPAAAVPVTRDLASLWDATPEAVLGEAVPDGGSLSTLRALLVGTAGSEMSVRAEDAAAARAFLERLLWNADAPRRRVERLLVRRFVGLVAIAVVAGLLVLGVRALTLGTNLAAGKPMRTSSSWPGCPSDPMCDGILLFHTNPENDHPWVEFDLLTSQTVKRIDVINRQDCCKDRTVPLVVEFSQDRVHWTEIARRIEEFSEWTLKIAPRKTRYVRLRIARPSTFHLKDVVIR